MKPIKAVIFDLGRVLVQVDFSRGILRNYAEKNELSDEKILAKAFRDPLFKKFSKGLIDPATFYDRLMERFPISITFSEFKKQWCDIFSPIDGMETLVKQIALKYPIGLLSDIDAIHWQYLIENYPILQHFHNPILSFKTGVLKPSRKAYHAAADAIGESPQFCLFIDDRPINIIGAKRAGMSTIHFKNPIDLDNRLRKLRILE